MLSRIIVGREETLEMKTYEGSRAGEISIRLNTIALLVLNLEMHCFGGLLF